jgi:hypothetical protein
MTVLVVFDIEAVPLDGRRHTAKRGRPPDVREGRDTVLRRAGF